MKNFLKQKKGITLITLVITIVLMIPTVIRASGEMTTITFKDKNLYNAIINKVEYLEKNDNTYSVTINDINNITELDLSNSYLQQSKKITDISGLENFTGLL